MMPSMPAFYLNPTTIDETVQQIAARSVYLLRLGQPVARAWDGGIGT